MIIKGFQKVSLIDYPGKVAAVVFVGGCNFRCPYCYNRDLVLGSNKLPTISEGDILAYLKKRKGLLDGVVLTGGESTLQKDLPDFARKIKDLGLLVKLDTNGTKSLSMKENGLVDFVALDVKAPLDLRYSKSIGLENFDDSPILLFERSEKCKVLERSERVLHSIRELTISEIDFELRTTVVPTLHSEKDLLDLARQLSEIAPKAKWFLQNFQPKNCLDPEFEKIEPYDKMFLEKLVEKLRVHMPNINLRE